MVTVPGVKDVPAAVTALTSILNSLLKAPVTATLTNRCGQAAR
jgi:hypothetical protein